MVRLELDNVVIYATNTQKDDAQDVYAVVSALRSPSSEGGISRMISRSSLSSVYNLVSDETPAGIPVLTSSIFERKKLMKKEAH